MVCLFRSSFKWMSSDSLRGRWLGTISQTDHDHFSQRPLGPELGRARSKKNRASHRLGTRCGLLASVPCSQACLQVNPAISPQCSSISPASRGPFCSHCRSPWKWRLWVFETRLCLRGPTREGAQVFFSAGHRSASPSAAPWLYSTSHALLALFIGMSQCCHFRSFRARVPLARAPAIQMHEDR